MFQWIQDKNTKKFPATTNKMWRDNKWLTWDVRHPVVVHHCSVRERSKYTVVHGRWCDRKPVVIVATNRNHWCVYQPLNQWNIRSTLRLTDVWWTHVLVLVATGRFDRFPFSYQDNQKQNQFVKKNFTNEKIPTRTFTNNSNYIL